MAHLISVTDKIVNRLDKIRFKHKNPINDKPASYSYAIFIILDERRKARKARKAKQEA